jgi:hypothetical protein
VRKQAATNWVNAVEVALNRLNRSALHYQVRYDDIWLLPIPPFSFMAHFRVDEENNSVWVEAIIHTSENPDGWRDRTLKNPSE